MSTVTTPTPDIWSMEVASTGGDYTPCPAGTFAGRICGLFDIGHHPEEKTDDKTKVKKMVDTHKLVLVVELTQKQPNGKPYTMGLKLTWSMHEKSNFFELVTNITGTKLAAGQSFNPLSLLGTPVTVNVVQSPNKKDPSKSFSNIGSLGQWMAGLPQPAWTYEPLSWSIRQTGVVFPEKDWLPLIYGKAIKTLAGESCEARGFAPGSAPATAPATPGVAAERPASPSYSPECLKLMERYGLQTAYCDDDIAEISGRLPGGLPDEERTILETFVTPF